MDQITNMLNSRQSSTLPSDIERNLKEHVNVVTLRSGKELSYVATEIKNNEEKVVAEEEQRVEVQKAKEDMVIPRRINFLDKPSFICTTSSIPSETCKGKTRQVIWKVSGGFQKVAYKYSFCKCSC